MTHKTRDWENWKRIQRSMEIEGWTIPEEQLLDVAQEYQAVGADALAARIAQLAAETGRPLTEVAREVLAAFNDQGEGAL